MKIKSRKTAAFWAIANGLLLAANMYLFFEDGLLAASSSDVPSPDDVDASDPESKSPDDQD